MVVYAPFAKHAIQTENTPKKLTNPSYTAPMGLNLLSLSLWARANFMTTIFGIKQCDTVRKACRWLEQHNLDYRFHDFRIDGLDSPTIKTWIDALGAETLVNKRSTTYRQLSDQDKTKLENDPATVLTEHPTLIKRPVVVHETELSVGFSDAMFTSLFNSKV
jgi:arsenate reductase